jgi:hypothetical protein
LIVADVVVTLVAPMLLIFGGTGGTAIAVVDWFAVAGT